LITIAKHYRKPPAEIARANHMKPDSRVRVGQRLVIPGVAQAKIKQPAPEPKVAATPAKPAPQQQAQAKPATPAKPATADKVAEKKPAEKKAEKVAEKKVASLGAPPSNLKEPVEKARIATPGNDAAAEAKDSQPTVTGATSPTFRWPVRGRVIAGFGAKPNGQQNDGINVAVPEGTSVKAAEDGVVAYAGNELKGYGNLVLVRHPNGYVTAYAHASELKVKRGDTIKRGQIIATAGQTGGVSSPQLHFEVRKGSTPVDPLPYLTAGN
jgi:murein DD-endopeptidase MepM/ murein hydrolase activator NlpD